MRVAACLKPMLFPPASPANPTSRAKTPVRAGMLWAGMLVLALQLPGLAQASDDVHWQDRDVMSDEVYLHYHPDQRYRGLGIEAYARQDYAAAMEYFLKAARYADKASQAFIASMYQEGRGVPRDPVAAYAWIDLSGERRSPALLAYREHYWSQLNESERARAVALGVELYADYGDDVAQARLEQIMLKGRSRAAIVNSPYLYVNGYLNWYDAKFWQPRQYWAFQDVLIREAMPQIGGRGRVEVGPLEPVREPPAEGDTGNP